MNKGAELTLERWRLVHHRSAFASPILPVATFEHDKVERQDRIPTAFSSELGAFR